MNKKITRRAVLGTAIAALVAGPFVMRAWRKGKGRGILADYGEQRKRYLEQLAFPRKYDLDLNYLSKCLVNKDELDKIVSIHKRYWNNYAKLHKAEFDYVAQTYEKGKKSETFWDMDVHIKMEYGYGFTAKGKDSTGYPVDLICTPDGCHIASARQNAGVSSLMISLFDNLLARPSIHGDYIGYRYIKEEGVEIMPNPYLNGDGLYDVLVVWNDKDGKVEKSDYYSRKTGMHELRYVRYPAGYQQRGWSEGDINLESETFWVKKYQLLDSIYLPYETSAHNEQGEYHSIVNYSNYSNIVLYPDT
jgi:hypothetical protein